MIYNIKNNKKDISLSELLQQNNIDFKLPCGGNHTCGKCKIKVSGELSSISKEEKNFLTKSEIENGYRMICFTKASSDIVVETENAKLNQILEKGIMDNFILDSLLLDTEYGIAIDIGTTTVVACLFKGNNKECIAVKSQLNMQKIYGADVISRINYSISNSVTQVNQTIINQVNDMIKLLVNGTGIPQNSIKQLVVTGNTTMLHFFANLDPKDIAFYPFIPKSLFGMYMENTMGLNITLDCKIYIPPCISAYVGADLLCCILSSDMIHNGDISFIVDIGTNGEMALYKNGQLNCCSTAAGPAFEGANLMHGSPAVEGAIYKVYYDENTSSIEYKTINDAPAIGICGSGIIDALAVLLKLNVIDNTGRFLKEGNPFTKNIIINENNETCFQFDNSNIYISQKDIRQIQLAKGAIAAGIETLLLENNIKSNEIQTFYICGGFGTYLDLNSAETIGLIPENIVDKVKVIGNGAIAGASRILLNKNSIGELDLINSKCSYIELSTSEIFMNKYIEKMNF
ncbi:MAG: ASKHA domain-containing protein [Tissierellia bacterium]|nr:ASKHA domain-containing protein [Tissierellia bacterium]MDD4780677.1 ASKHA domain-containing protein [Tissierellia bacterium]